MKKNILNLVLFELIIFSLLDVSALSIGVHVPEKYVSVMAGERFYFEIEIKYPENPSRKDLKLNYEILKDDEPVAQSKSLKAVGTQASFIDFIVIPESAEKGMHIIRIEISDYDGLNEEVEASFDIVSGGEQIKLYFFILLGFIILVGGLVIINIVLDKKK